MKFIFPILLFSIILNSTFAREINLSCYLEQDEYELFQEHPEISFKMNTSSGEISLNWLGAINIPCVSGLDVLLLENPDEDLLIKCGNGEDKDIFIFSENYGIVEFDNIALFKCQDTELSN